VKYLALTFDYYPQVVVARDIMSANNISIATYYAWYPNILANGSPSGDQISLADLTLMKMLGWEIGAYTNDNMIDKLNNNRNLANNFLRDLDNGINAAGFKAETIAPNQRAWSTSLANMVRGRFKGVRVAANLLSQSLPIVDPCFINNGGGGSWGSTGSLTPSDILNRIDAIVNNCLGIEVIHKVGSDNDSLSFSVANFTTVMNGIISRIANGNLKLVTMSQAINLGL